MDVRVYLLKDIARIGMSGEIIKVSEGYARNFLIPNKLGVEVTNQNEKMFANRTKHLEKRGEVIATQTSMLAEKVKSTEIVLRKKMHNDGKLYGAISGSDIVDELAKKGITISKNQIELDKSIKSKGIYDVTIKLSSKLKPTLKVKVVAE